MFDWVLNTPLQSYAYETNQTIYIILCRIEAKLKWIEIKKKQ